MSDEKPMEVITLPKIQGGVVTRMAVLPSNGVKWKIDAVLKQLNKLPLYGNSFEVVYGGAKV